MRAVRVDDIRTPRAAPIAAAARDAQLQTGRGQLTGPSRARTDTVARLRESGPEQAPRRAADQYGQLNAETMQPRSTETENP